MCCIIVRSDWQSPINLPSIEAFVWLLTPFIWPVYYVISSNIVTLTERCHKHWERRGEEVEEEGKVIKQFNNLQSCGKGTTMILFLTQHFRVFQIIDYRWHAEQKFIWIYLNSGMRSISGLVDLIMIARVSGGGSLEDQSLIISGTRENQTIPEVS